MILIQGVEMVKLIFQDNYRMLVRVEIFKTHLSKH
jgi:hypothetical protein